MKLLFRCHYRYYKRS